VGVFGSRNGLVEEGVGLGLLGVEARAAGRQIGLPGGVGHPRLGLRVGLQPEGLLFKIPAGLAVVEHFGAQRLEGRRSRLADLHVGQRQRQLQGAAKDEEAHRDAVASAGDQLTALAGEGTVKDLDLRHEHSMGRALGTVGAGGAQGPAAADQGSAMA
jgi:hypothetical protein